MIGLMNENQLTIVKKCEIIKPLIHKIDSSFENCCRECHNKYYHTFEYECGYDIKLTNIRSNEIENLTIVDKSMGLFELNKKLTVARHNGFIFNQINKITIKVYSNLQSIIIYYSIKHGIPMCHRLFFRIISQNKEYVERFCNDRNNPFHFACHIWYLYKNPQY